MTEATSCPYAPTFCTGVPPTVPGIPARHSIPAHSNLNGPLDKVVPVFAGRNAKQLPVPLDSLQPNMQHQPRESLIGDEHIAAAAQHKQRHAPLARPLARLRNLRLARRLRKPPRRPANAKGRKRREELSFFDLHRFKATPMRAEDGKMSYRQLPLPEANMYPELMVIPMREELVRAGIKETRTAEEVDAALAEPGTTLVVVNSICGCAAGKARPGIRLALSNSANQPDRKITVFAGQDREATERARSYFEGHPPSSPSVAILRDGKLVYLMQRSVIEQSTAQDIAAELMRAFDEFCAKTTA